MAAQKREADSFSIMMYIINFIYRKQPNFLSAMRPFSQTAKWPNGHSAHRLNCCLAVRPFGLGCSDPPNEMGQWPKGRLAVQLIDRTGVQPNNRYGFPESALLRILDPTIQTSGLWAFELRKYSRARALTRSSA